MRKNYLKIAIANLVRNKFYSILNISGLLIGFAVSLVMMMIIHFGTEITAVAKFSGRTMSTGEVRIFAAIAASVLALASVNFIRLIVLQAIRRKTLYGQRLPTKPKKIQQLLVLLTETSLLVIAAMVLAIVLVFFMAGSLGSLFEFQISLVDIPFAFLFNFLGVILVALILIAATFLTLTIFSSNSISRFMQWLNHFRTRGLKQVRLQQPKQPLSPIW